jgi:cytidylate kinase
MASLNEAAGTSRDAWIYSNLFGKSVSRDDYLFHLVATVRGLNRLGGIIMGRGAHIILESRGALRVRITGSVEACTRRVAEEDGIDQEAAERKVLASHRKRGRFLWEMFHRRLNDPANFDLVINTDRLRDATVAANMIVMGVKALEGDQPSVGLQ